MRPEDLYDAFHEIDDDLLKPLPEDGVAVDPDTRNFPVFYREELTRDVLAARLWQGDFAGCSGASFGVLEPDGTLLEISVYAQDPLALLEFLLDG